MVGLTTAVQVSIGPIFNGAPHNPSTTCARLATGDVRCWGSGLSGQLGNGTADFALTPVPVSGLTDAVDVSVAYEHGCAVRSDTTVVCWGSNAFGQLGDGTLTTRLTPVTVRTGPGVAPPLTGVVDVEAGGTHTCARLIDRSVRCWGWNINGQLGDASFDTRRYPVRPLGLGSVVEVTTGSRHSCARLADGSGRCWGEPDFGKLGSPPSIWSTGVPQAVQGLVGAADLSAGTVDTCAAMTDGTARCWGDNRFAQIGDGTTADRSTPRDVVGLGGAPSAGVHQVCVRGTDRVGNVSGGTACASLTIVDESPPEVVGILATPPSPTGALTITFAVTFDADVTGFTVADLQIGGTSTPWTASVTGSGAVRTVTLASTNPTDGQLTVAIKADSVLDLAGNAGPLEAVAALPMTILPFTDITASPFIDDIVWLTHEGITSGCGTRRFCPDATVTREQMASFLARALDLPSTAVDHFIDDETSPHEVDINRLAAAGVTTGCAPDHFCPTATLTRGQMASFLARAYDLPSSAEDPFEDDDGSVHEADINRLAAAGITTGCDATRFCPDGLVTRGQMAAFLHRSAILVAAFGSEADPPPADGPAVAPSTPTATPVPTAAPIPPAATPAASPTTTETPAATPAASPTPTATTQAPSPTSTGGPGPVPAP